MSRSFRKSPIAALSACDSEAKFKARAARAARHAVHRVLAAINDFDTLVPPLVREVLNFRYHFRGEGSMITLTELPADFLTNWTAPTDGWVAYDKKSRKGFWLEGVVGRTVKAVSLQLGLSVPGGSFFIVSRVGASQKFPPPQL